MEALAALTKTTTSAVDLAVATVMIYVLDVLLGPVRVNILTEEPPTFSRGRDNLSILPSVLDLAPSTGENRHF